MVDYWLPTWWSWIDNWHCCQTCLEYNGTPCASCQIPPGMLGMVQLVGGGIAEVAGNLRGNAMIATERQANAAARVSSAGRVDQQLRRQQRALDLSVTAEQINRKRRNTR